MSEQLVEVGILHGVKIFISDENSKMFPCNDHEGVRRPYITIKPDYDPMELFDDVCYVRGRYDLSRVLDGFEPIEWEAGPGTWRDIYAISHQFEQLKEGLHHDQA